MRRFDRLQAKLGTLDDEHNNNNNDHVDDDLSENADEESLAQALEDAIKLESTGNLYAMAMRDFILRVNLDYNGAAIQIIKTGFANEAWTEKKMTLASVLSSIAEKAMAECETGLDVKNQLLTDIDNFQKEMVPAARSEHQQKNNASAPPKEGRMEMYYIPAIIRATNIVYRIYALYQITDKRAENYLMCEGDGEKFGLLRSAESFARTRVQQLLHKIDEKSLRTAESMLSAIESNSKRFMTLKAVKNKNDRKYEDVIPWIDEGLFASVNGIFATKIDEMEKEALRRANSNIITITKRAVHTGCSMASSAASTIGSAASKVGEYALDYWVPTQGPQQPTPASGSKNPDKPKVQVEQQPGQVMMGDYDPSESQPSSPKSPVFKKAPVIQRTNDDDDDEDAELMEEKVRKSHDSKEKTVVAKQKHKQKQ